MPPRHPRLSPRRRGGGCSITPYCFQKQCGYVHFFAVVVFSSPVLPPSHRFLFLEEKPVVPRIVQFQRSGILFLLSLVSRVAHQHIPQSCLHCPPKSTVLQPTIQTISPWGPWPGVSHTGTPPTIEEVCTAAGPSRTESAGLHFSTTTFALPPNCEVCGHRFWPGRQPLRAGVSATQNGRSTSLATLQFNTKERRSKNPENEAEKLPIT